MRDAAEVCKDLLSCIVSASYDESDFLDRYKAAIAAGIKLSPTLAVMSWHAELNGHLMFNSWELCCATLRVDAPAVVQLRESFSMADSDLCDGSERFVEEFLTKTMDASSDSKLELDKAPELAMLIEFSGAFCVASTSNSEK